MEDFALCMGLGLYGDAFDGMGAENMLMLGGATGNDELMGRAVMKMADEENGVNSSDRPRRARGRQNDPRQRITRACEAAPATNPAETRCSVCACVVHPKDRASHESGARHRKNLAKQPATTATSAGARAVGSAQPRSDQQSSRATDNEAPATNPAETRCTVCACVVHPKDRASHDAGGRHRKNLAKQSSSTTAPVESRFKRPLETAEADREGGRRRRGRKGE